MKKVSNSMSNYFINENEEKNDNLIGLIEGQGIVDSLINRPHKFSNQIKAYPVLNLNNTKAQMGLVVKDLLFVLIGYEGNYIRYSEKYNPNIIEHLVKGPDFKVAKHLDISLKSITKKIVRLGKYYSGIRGFVRKYDNNQLGRVVQKLCFVINEFSEHYHEIILHIENEFKNNCDFNLNIFESIMSQEVSKKLDHLYEIVHEIFFDLNLSEQSGIEDKVNDVMIFSKMIEDNDQIEMVNCDASNFKGAMVMQVVQKRINNYKGDIVSFNFLVYLFETISDDYLFILNKWLSTGEIDDPFDEFLIKRINVSFAFQNFFHHKSQNFWSELFVLRSKCLITQFSNPDIEKKILNTGKYLNIFKVSTGIHDFDCFDIPFQPITKIFSQDLELKINLYYFRANKFLISLLFKGFDFMFLIEHLNLIFFFSKSHKIQFFLEKTFNYLKKNKNIISLSRIQKVYHQINQGRSLDSNFSNRSYRYLINDLINNNCKFIFDGLNFYNLINEIMNVKAFDTKKYENLFNENSKSNDFEKYFDKNKSSTSSKTYNPNSLDDYAIAFSDIDLKLPFPLNLIIKSESLYYYKLVFKFQLILKFLDKLNEILWKETNYSSVWVYKKYDSKISKWILKCRLLQYKTRMFLNELQNFISFSIIENNYSIFKEFLGNIESCLKDSNSIFSTENYNFKPLNLNKNSLNSYNTNNNIFDIKLEYENFNNPKILFGQDEKKITNVESLIEKLNEFLMNIVNDMLITKPEILVSLKNMFDTIILFNHYIMKLKKVLILTDQNLFSKYSNEHLEKFKNKTVDIDLINKRLFNLNESLNDYYSSFNNFLDELIVTLKTFGEFENKQILMLTERLMFCFFK